MNEQIQKHSEYAKHIEADSYVQKWVQTTLANYLEKNTVTTEEVEHILDYLVMAKKKVQKMSYEQAKDGADKWLKAQIKKGNAIEEKPEDVETVLDYGDGFRVVKLIGENAYKREGFLMSNCVASYYGRSVEVYSLRDENNMPHATIEKDQQVKGKGNGDIHPKYVDYVVKFLEHVGMTVGDSEMKHLGYINISKWKKELHADTIAKCYGDYIQENEQLLDKNGEVFASLDLWDVKDLVKLKFDGAISLQSDLATFLVAAVQRLFNKGKSKKSDEDNEVIGSSGYSAQIGSSGDYAQIGSSGYSARIGSSGYSAQIGSSGDSAQIGSSGDSARIGSSGYSAQIGSSGDSARIGSSGYSARIGSSGDYAQIGSSGYSARIGSSGYSAQIGSSGYSARIGSSGYSARIGSSGDSAQIELNGQYSVGMNAGYDSRIKGKIGNWITLAEWERQGDNWVPICVKSAQIDGKTLKEDTWYKLEKGEFIEVE